MKILPILVGMFLLSLVALVPWVDAQQKPSPVAIWCQDGSGNFAPCQSGPTAFASADNIANQTATVIHGFGFMFDGSTWDRLRGDSTNGLLVNLGANNDVTITSGTVAATQSGTWNLNNISGTISLPTGAATAALQDGIIKDGAGDTTQANVSSGRLHVDGSGVTQPVSGTITANAGTDLNTSALLTTAAHDGAFGTAGTPDTQVRSIQGIASGTPVGVQSNGANLATEATLSTSNTNTGNTASGVGATGDAAATAGSTGSLNAKLRLMTTQLNAIQTAVELIDNDQTGGTMSHYISVGTTEDEHQVKGSAGRLFSINVTNTNAAVRYLRCADQVAASTTPGTTSVWYGMAIPGQTTGAGFTATFGPSGVAFATGLTCWLVTGAAETDVAEVAANEINVNYVYK